MRDLKEKTCACRSNSSTTSMPSDLDPNGGDAWVLLNGALAPVTVQSPPTMVLREGDSMRFFMRLVRGFVCLWRLGSTGISAGCALEREGAT